MRVVSERNRAPLLLTVAMFLLAVLAFGATTWRQPASSAEPITGSTVGPFTSGESFSQRFLSEVTYFSRIDVRVRARSENEAPVNTELHFRLFESDELVREGRVIQSDLPESSHAVGWSFPPIAGSAGREYELQVVVADISGGTLIADTTTEDTHPGPILTNGLPSGEHVDLVLRPYRELRRTGIVLAIGDSIPFGWIGVPVFLAITGAIGGFGLQILRHGFAKTAPIDWLLWGILGIGFVSLASSVPVIQFRAAMAAEDDPGLILATRGVVLGTALTPWVIFLAATATGRLASLRTSGFRGRLFVSAAATTAIGLLLLIFTEEPAYFQWIEMVEGGRPD